MMLAIAAIIAIVELFYRLSLEVPMTWGDITMRTLYIGSLVMYCVFIQAKSSKSAAPNPLPRDSITFKGQSLTVPFISDKGLIEHFQNGARICRESLSRAAREPVDDAYTFEVIRHDNVSGWQVVNLKVNDRYSIVVAVDQFHVLRVSNITLSQDWVVIMAAILAMVKSMEIYGMVIDWVEYPDAYLLSDHYRSIIKAGQR